MDGLTDMDVRGRWIKSRETKEKRTDKNIRTHVQISTVYTENSMFASHNCKTNYTAQLHMCIP